MCLMMRNASRNLVNFLLHILFLVAMCAIVMGPLQLFVAAAREVRRDLVQIMESRPDFGMISQKERLELWLLLPHVLKGLQST